MYSIKFPYSKQPAASRQLLVIMNLTRDLEPVWLISTMDKKPTRQDIQKINIEQSAREIIRKKGGALSLRVESQLLFGLASILSRKAHHLLEDSTETNKGLIKMFSQNEIDLVIRPESSELTLASQPTQMIDLLPQDLNLGKVLAKVNTESMIRSQNRDLSSELGSSELGIDIDQSVDLVTRRGEDGNMLDDSILPHTDGDEEMLSRLNLTDNIMLSDDNDFSLGADDFEMGGSSPPAEVSTPLGEDSGQIVIVDGDEELSNTTAAPKRKSRKRTAAKKKLAPLDEQISAPLPSRPSDNILTTPAKLTLETPATEMDKYLDPEYIHMEIKRRRLMGSDEIGGDEDDAIDDDFEIPELDQSTMMWDEDGPSLNDDRAPSESDRIEPDGPLAILEDPSAIEAEAASAKAALESAIQNKAATFKDIGSSRLQKAAAFAEMLTMAAQGKVRVNQNGAFTDIRIQAVSTK